MMATLKRSAFAIIASTLRVSAFLSRWFRGGVGTTPGVASQGNLSALDAGGKNFGAEADMGHAMLLLLIGASNGKGPPRRA
jgi:hypothetical protein